VVKTVIGPVLARPGGFSFDIWQTSTGLKPSFTYRRVEDAYYARNYELVSLCALACDTVASFMAELA
jgi:hypothetical protein